MSERSPAPVTSNPKSWQGVSILAIADAIGNCHPCYQDLCSWADELDRQRAEIAELRGALEALYDEQNGPPLFSRERQWKVAMERAKVALTRSHAEPGKAP